MASTISREPPRDEPGEFARQRDDALSRSWDEIDGQGRGISWLASTVVHLLLFLAFSWWWSPPPRGVAIEPDRDAGIVLVGETAGQVEYYGPEGDAGDESPTDAAAGAATGRESAVAAALPGGGSPPIDPNGALPAGPAPGAGGLGDGALPGAGALTQGGATGSVGKIGANKGHTYLFGIQGVGNKFVYVFDRSASMEGYEGRPLAAAKTELRKSLEQLDAIHQFQIIFYNDRQNVFNPYLPQPPRMLFADEKHRDLAQRYIRSVTADGGTRHLEALRLALNFGPDVVFFLTDADEPELTPAELADVARRTSGAVIHAIEFGAGPKRSGENFLQRLARQSGGQHVYVDVTRLGK